MPTRLPRHTLTENGEVAAALRSARELLPDGTDGERLRLLLSLGGESLLERHRREQAAHRRRAQRRLLAGAGAEDETALVLTDLLDGADT